jgi:hypothetical protein
MNSKLKKDGRWYPKRGPGMTTAEYVALFCRMNHYK